MDGTLRRFLAEKGMSIKGLAEQMGYHPNTLEKHVNRAPPTFAVAGAFCWLFLDTDLDWCREILEEAAMQKFTSTGHVEKIERLEKTIKRLEKEVSIERSRPTKQRDFTVPIRDQQDNHEQH